MLHTDIQTDIHFTIIYIYHHHQQQQHHHHHCHHHIWECTQALQYVKNYAGGSSMWQGFPIKVLIIHIVIIALSTWLSSTWWSTLLSSTSLSTLYLLSWNQVDVPTDRILLGCKGASSSSTIKKLAEKSVRQDLLGVMVWFCRSGIWSWHDDEYGHDNCDYNSDFLL